MSECGGMSVGLLFPLNKFSRKFYNTFCSEKRKKERKKIQKTAFVMFMEMIEIDSFSLNYQRATPNIFNGSLAFFQKRCYLIYCNAYCDACPACFPPEQWGTAAGKHPLLQQPHSRGRGETSPTSVFLICC
jgi:hypothetical protein